MVAWEPVPKFRHFIELGMQLNHFQAQVLVRPTAVADQDGGSYTLKVPQRGIWGTASIGGGNIDAYAPQVSQCSGSGVAITHPIFHCLCKFPVRECWPPCRAIDNEGAYEVVEVAGERVDSLIKEDVLLVKLDVEGFEPTAFRSSTGLLDHYRYVVQQASLAQGYSLNDLGVVLEIAEGLITPMNEQGSKCHNGIFSWGVRQSPALGRIYRLAQHAAQVWPVIPFRALDR